MKREFDSIEETTTTTTTETTSSNAAKGSKPPKHKKPKMKWGLRRGPITGSKGLLVTCSVSCEQRCANEISSFLEIVSQSLLSKSPATNDVTISSDVSTSKEQQQEQEEPPKKKMTLQEMLDMEKEEMEKEPEVKESAFIPMYSGVNGVIFIKMTHSDLTPTALAEAAAERIQHPQAGDVHLRHTIRIVPLEKTCQVSVDDIVSTLKPIIEREFRKDGGVKYRFEYKSRNNSSVSRTNVFPALMPVIPSGNTVDLKNSDVVVIIEIFKTTCGVAVSSKYDALGKFNLRAIAEAKMDVKKKEEKKEKKEESVGESEKKESESDKKEEVVNEEAKN